MELKKYKVCPSCGEHNRPTSLECRKCETDLTGVRVVDNEIEQREAEKAASENIGTTGANVTIGALVRVCEECGAENVPQLTDDTMIQIYHMTHQVPNAYSLPIRQLF